MFNILKESKVEKIHKSRYAFVGDRKPKLKFSLTQSQDPGQSLRNAPAPQEIKKYEVSEMYYEDDLLIFLTSESKIYLFNIFTSKMNIITTYTKPNKIAKSITVNKLRNSMLIVYIQKQNSVQELKCVEVPVDTLKTLDSNDLPQEHLRYLFEAESLFSPAFIEFDEINKIILTKNSLGTYKIWEMKAYKKNFELTDRRIEEVRLAEDVLLTIQTSSNSNEKIFLSVFDITNGKNIFNFVISLIPNASLIFLELFRNVLFLKQENHVPIFMNLISLENYFLKEDFDEEAFFIYISKQKKVLAFNYNYVYFYDLKGNLVNKIRRNFSYFRPSSIAISNLKNLFAFTWNFSSESSSKQSKSNWSSDSGDVLRKSSLKSEEEENYLLGSIKSKKRNLFNCELSPIENENEETDCAIVGEESYLKMSMKNSIEVVDLEDIEKGVIAKFSFRNTIGISSILLNSNLMKIFYVTFYGEIYELNL